MNLLNVEAICRAYENRRICRPISATASRNAHAETRRTLCIFFLWKKCQFLFINSNYFRYMYLTGFCRVYVRGGGGRFARRKFRIPFRRPVGHRPPRFYYSLSSSSITSFPPRNKRRFRLFSFASTSSYIYPSTCR